jgi:kinesin family protein 4/21/27
MRLQEVLREREAEITMMEQSLKESKQKDPQQVPSPIIVNGVDGKVIHVEDSDDGISNGEIVDALSPRTLNRFDNIRKTMEIGHSDAVSSQNEDESLERLNELMLYDVDCLSTLSESDTLSIDQWPRRSPSIKKL